MKRIVLISITAVALLLLALDLFIPEMGLDKVQGQDTGVEKAGGSNRNTPPSASIASGGGGTGYSGTSQASRKPSPPPSTQDSEAPPKSAYQVPQMYEADEYFQLYSEQGLSLLPSDATNLTPEAVTRADNWKRAGDWDQGLLRMNETFNASLDPSSALAVPAFQVPAFTPAVQMPAVPTCCVAP